MTIEGVLHDMRLDLHTHKTDRGKAIRYKRYDEKLVLDGKIEELGHWLKLLEKIEKAKERDHV